LTASEHASASQMRENHQSFLCRNQYCACTFYAAIAPTDRRLFCQWIVRVLCCLKL